MLSTLTLAYNRAITNCSHLLLSRIRRHSWAFCRHDGMGKLKHNIPKHWHPVYCRVLVVYTCDYVPDWKLRFTATAQHQESVVPHIVSTGKYKNSKLEV